MRIAAESDRVLVPCVQQQQQGSASRSFLLDDDSSGPFNVEDVQTVTDDKALHAAMAPPRATAQQSCVPRPDLELSSVSSTQ